MEMVTCSLGISSPEEFHRDRNIPKYRARCIMRSMVLAHEQHVWDRKGAISHSKAHVAKRQDTTLKKQIMAY